MRLWTLEDSADVTKFAQLLMSGTTDAIWVGKVDCIDTDDEGCGEDIASVVFYDCEGNLTAIGDVELDDVV